MKSRRRATSSLFRKAAAAPTLRPPVRMSRGSANARWNPGSIFSSSAVNLLLLLVVVGAIVACLFIGIPSLLGEKKERQTTPGMWKPTPEDK
jgi:hypothetical protein